MKKRAIIDGHTDVLLALTQQRRKFSEESSVGHVDLPRMRKGNVAAMFFAIWPGINQYYIHKGTRQLLDLLENPANEARLILSHSDLEKANKEDKVGAIFHIEGIGGLDTEMHLLHILYRLGLRSFGITWSDENIFATGVSFMGPEIKDTRGLTAEGQDLITEANKLGIIVDVSHLSDKSFWDVLEVTQKPVIASHSSCRSISPHPRNLTDEMIKALADNGGIIGINFGNSFLRADRNRKTDTPISTIVDHIDHVKNLVGPKHVAFGSDFDGTGIPDELNDVTGYNKIILEMEKRDYSEDEIELICNGNFQRIMKAVWK